MVRPVQIASLIAGVDLEPFDGFCAAVGLGDGGIDHLLGGRPDVNTGSIAADEGDDRVVRNHRLAVLEADHSTAGGGGQLLVGGHWMRKPQMFGIVSLVFGLRCHECR